MREIHTDKIVETVKKLCIEANYELPKDVETALINSVDDEVTEAGKAALEASCKNLEMARKMNIPICQDTGIAVVFIEIGQDVHITGGSLEDAINEGVRQGYKEGFLRCSIVKDPFKRENTGDNTPAIIHTKIVSGENINITVSPKGCGSENMSALKMFTPSASRDEIIGFIVDIVKKAGSNPCPPVIVGVGIGGNFEYCAYLAKKALLRDITLHNDNDYYAEMESEILTEINKTGIGPQGFGGKITALAVNIEVFPTHIAGLPVAVNMGCHISRHKSKTL